MDTNATNTSIDLIAEKTAAFSELPGLILGLDGWILRSVPKEFRKQFLEGYLRLLRIVFHPDRYQRQIEKDSKQNYLQSVEESVRFMLGDEFSFEISVDAVPSRKNPIVGLKRDVQVRDDVIVRLNKDSEDAQRMTKKAVSDQGSLRTKLRQMENRLLSQFHRHNNMMIALRSITSRYPVPLKLRRINLECACVTGDLLADSTSVKWLLNQSKPDGNIKKIEFRNGRAIEDDVHWRIISGLLCSELAACIRDNTQAVGGEDVVKFISASLAQSHPKDITLMPYSFPFVMEKEWLIVQRSELLQKGADRSWKTNHELWWVDSCNASEAPLKSLVETLKDDNRKLEIDARLHTEKMKEASREKKSLKNSLEKVSNDLEKAEREIATLKKKNQNHEN